MNLDEKFERCVEKAMEHAKMCVYPADSGKIYVETAKAIALYCKNKTDE
jgi:hypothetical protein